MAALEFRCGHEEGQPHMATLEFSYGHEVRQAHMAALDFSVVAMKQDACICRLGV
jgi:hypothetical protein